MRVNICFLFFFKLNKILKIFLENISPQVRFSLVSVWVD